MLTRTASVSLRLLAEVLGVAAAAQALAALAVHAWAADASPTARAAMSVLFALLLATPLLYWRCTRALHRASTAAGRPAPARDALRTVGWVLSAALAVQVAGLGLTIAIVHWHQQSIDAAARARFDRYADHLVEAVTDRLEEPLALLKGARGVWAASDEVTREDFRAYVESTDMAADRRLAHGLGFIERMPPHPPAGGSPGPSYIVRYIEPVERNQEPLGRDVAGEPRRRDAVEQAIDSGLPTLTSPVTLLRQHGGTPGVLLYLPVYQGHPDSVQERRTALLGVLYARIVLGETLAGIDNQFDREIEFRVLDADDGGGTELLYDMREARTTAPMFADRRPLNFAGRSLQIDVATTPAFDRQVERNGLWMTGLAGCATSLLAAMATWLLGIGRVQADQRARRMTAELDRLARVARHTSNAVIIYDAQVRITWVNEGFTRIYGHAAADVIGREPGPLLGSFDADPDGAQLLHESAHGGLPCRTQVRNRRKDGSDCWMDVDLQPLHDADGHLVGLIEIGTEVTQQRATQQRLEAALRETRALLGAVQTHAIVSVSDAQGVISEVNDAFCEISGYSRAELIGRSHSIMSSGVHDAAFWQTLWQTIASGRPWRGRICNRTKDGRLYWLDSMIAPFLGADGRIEKYVSIRTDVTDSVQAEQALARERQRLEQIIRGTNVGTWEWNVDTGETAFNERWAEIVGYRLEELGPWSIDTWSRFVHPEDLKRSSIALERHFDGLTEHYECEARMRHKDGHWVWVLDRGKLFTRTPDGRPQWMAGTHQDVTERKAAEAALLASQALLERMGRIAQVGGWELDFASGALHWSDEIAHLLEFEPDSPATLERLVERFTPEAREALHLALATAREEGLGWDVEWPVTTVGGRPLWVRSLGEVAFDAGRPARLIGTLQDVTARRHLQDELRRQNDLLENVLENLPCGLGVFDHQLKMVAHNRTLKALLELPDAMFAAGTPSFEEIVRLAAERGEYGPGDIESIVASRLALIQNPVPGRRGERQLPGGGTLEIRGAPMPDGGFVATYIDVSDRKRAEAEAERSHALLRAALETVDEAFVLYGPDDRLVMCNDKYRALYATSAAAIVPGAAFEDLIRYGVERGQFVEAVGREEEWIAERMASHRQPSSAFVQTLDDGRVLRVIERRMPDGHTVGFRIDVTDFERGRQAAEEASQAKSRFLANMSHEIRTPMNAVLGMLRLLRRTSLDTRQADYAGKAEGAARALLALLDDVLDFSKIEAGKLVLDPRPFDRDAWLSDLGTVLSAGLRDKPVELLFDIDPTLPRTLIGDDLRLRQVLVNLGGNAVKFTERGEVVLRIRAAAADGDGLLVDFEVVDSGIGIAPEHQARIFDSFTQAEASTTRRYGGTGLGVAISHRLVALMGGQLALRSEPGRGSTFSFRVRLGGSASAPAWSSPGTRCVMIDDQPTARALLSKAAESLGWSVQAHASIDEAAHALGNALERQVALVVVDGGLLDDEGHALARLRAAAPGARIAGLASHALDDRACLAGCDARLAKPFVASDLEVLLQRPVTADEPEVAGAPRRLAGLRLLVVEDNANNRQIAHELLSDEGADVQLAENGSVAVQAIEHAPTAFDAVLMDLQMPVMDGLAATAEIRHRLGLTSLPIVATTANAMASDREACLAAGMDAHIGKPFDLDRLVHLLLRLTHPDRNDDATTTAPPPQPAADTVLDVAGALTRFGGKRAVYRRSLVAFAADLPATARHLATLVRAGQREPASQLAHGVKGLAGTLGAGVLARHAADLEAWLADGARALPDAEALADGWRRTVEPALAAMRAAIDSLPAEDALPRPVPGAADPTALRRRLDELAALLDAGDMRADDVFAALRAECGLGHAARLGALERAIVALDFAAARAACAEWVDALPAAADASS